MRLESLTKRELIKCQIDEWDLGDYQYTLHYLTNLIKILVGKEPDYVSPRNKLVNSEFIFRDETGKRNELFYVKGNFG